MSLFIFNMSVHHVWHRNKEKLTHGSNLINKMAVPQSVFQGFDVN